jgi:hypothetical protein
LDQLGCAKRGAAFPIMDLQARSEQIGMTRLEKPSFKLDVAKDQIAKDTVLAMQHKQQRMSGAKSEAGRLYFFLPDPKFGCHPVAPPFWLGAAAIVLIFSFLGFLDSRLPFFSPLAIAAFPHL